jgi:hypothetical protein
MVIQTETVAVPIRAQLLRFPMSPTVGPLRSGNGLLVVSLRVAFGLRPATRNLFYTSVTS